MGIQNFIDAHRNFLTYIQLLFLFIDKTNFLITFNHKLKTKGEKNETNQFPRVPPCGKKIKRIL